MRYKVKPDITDNIEAFDDLEYIVRKYLRNNNVPDAFIFYEDATGNGIVSSNKDFSGTRLTILFETYGARIYRIPEGEYRKFEKQWKRIDSNSIEAEEIYRRLYQLCEMDKRRSTGSFYTPYKLAKLAWQMIVNQLDSQRAADVAASRAANFVGDRQKIYNRFWSREIHVGNSFR